MLKITNKQGLITYILEEKEYVSLASQEAKDLVLDRLNNLEKYINNNIDFFTGKEVKEENKWYFNVNKDNKLYTCIYDNEHIEHYNKTEKETRCFLMWRYGDGSFSYYETIGNFIDNNNIYTPEDTKYNDVTEWLFDNKKKIIQWKE